MTETAQRTISQKRLAVNSQISPFIAGGVETNLLSMLRAHSDLDRNFRISLLVLDEFVEPFRKEAPFAEIISWPYGQSIEEPPMRPAARGQTFRRMLGRHAHVFDHTVRQYRRLRYGAVDTSCSPDRLLFAHGIQALHFPAPQLFRTKLPFLYEPWDLQHLHYPEFFSEQEFSFRENMYRWGCSRATLILTATDWVKNDIATKYGVERERIVTIPRSSLFSRCSLSDRQIDNEIHKADVPSDFIFYPAMCFEHKNHIRLFQALARLRDRDGLKVNLVLSGRKHEPFWPKVASAIEKLQLQSQIRFLGQVSDELLTALYKRARFMVFPSLFEGLGLPLLEAFHHRLPILAAQATCIPEVVGEDAVLFNGKDVDAIAAAIVHAYHNPEHLRLLVERGSLRLSEFSWERSRPLLSACYKHVLNMEQTEEERALFARATCQ